MFFFLEHDHDTFHLIDKARGKVIRGNKVAAPWIGKDYNASGNQRRDIGIWE